MKKWLFISLMLLFTATFCVSLYFILTNSKESRENEVLYEELADMVAEIRATIPPAESVDPDDPNPPTRSYVEAEDEQSGTEVRLLPEYEPIYRLNNDLVGWIRIENTNINYPVLQSPEAPNYYIDHNFYGEASKYGAIYAGEHCDVSLPSDNIIIYGHRMNDGSMFADLLKYKNKDFYDTHKYIYFDTLTERQKYEIVAVFQIKSVRNNNFQYHKFVKFDAESQFDTFMSRVDLLELYDTGTTASFGDELITLSTCQKGNSGGRFVVIAKKIS